MASNSKLQVFNLNGNNLQTAGIAKIAKSLRHTSTLVLTKLFINSNNIASLEIGFFDVFMNKQIEISIFITMADSCNKYEALYSITEIM